MIAHATTVDVATLLAAITAVSGLSFYYSSVVAQDVVVLAVVAMTVVSGSSSYYSSAAAWDAVTLAVVAIADASLIFLRGMLMLPRLVMHFSCIIFLIFLHIYNIHLFLL